MTRRNFLGLWRTLQGLLFLILATLAGLTFHSSASGPVPALSTHVSRLAVHLLDYLEDPQAATLAKITAEEKEISGRFQRINGRHAARPGRSGSLESAGRTLQDVTLQILQMEAALRNDRTILNERQAQLDDVLRDPPQSPRRTRGRLVLATELAGDIALRRTRIDRAARLKTALLEKFLAAQGDLNAILSREKPQSSSAWPVLGLLTVLLAVGLGLFGLDLLLRRRLFQPLKDLTAVTEAIAAGDGSRTPDIWAQDEMGQMAKAVNRLAGVLARSENLTYHLATLVDSSGDGIISQTLDGTILSWNKGAQRIYGYSAEEVKGQSITLLVPEGGRSQLSGILERVRSGERIQPFEMTHRGKDGRIIHVFLRVACIYDSTKKAIGASICAQDMQEVGLQASRWTPGTHASGDYRPAEETPSSTKVTPSLTRHIADF